MSLEEFRHYFNTIQYMMDEDEKKNKYQKKLNTNYQDIESIRQKRSNFDVARKKKQEEENKKSQRYKDSQQSKSRINELMKRRKQIDDDLKGKNQNILDLLVPNDSKSLKAEKYFINKEINEIKANEKFMNTNKANVFKQKKSQYSYDVQDQNKENLYKSFKANQNVGYDKRKDNVGSKSLSYADVADTSNIVNNIGNITNQESNVKDVVSKKIYDPLTRVAVAYGSENSARPLPSKEQLDKYGYSESDKVDIPFFGDTDIPTAIGTIAAYINPASVTNMLFKQGIKGAGKITSKFALGQSTKLVPKITNSLVKNTTGLGLAELERSTRSYIHGNLEVNSENLADSTKEWTRNVATGLIFASALDGGTAGIKKLFNKVSGNVDNVVDDVAKNIRVPQIIDDSLKPTYLSRYKQRTSIPSKVIKDKNAFYEHYGLNQDISNADTKKVFEKIQSDIGSRIKNKVKSDNLNDVVNYYKSKYGLDYNIQIKNNLRSENNIARITIENGTKQGDNIKISINKSKPKDAQIGALRHEIEHLIDYNRKFIGKDLRPKKVGTIKEAYTSKEHHQNYGFFEPDYLRKAMLKDMKKGRLIIEGEGSRIKMPRNKLVSKVKTAEIDQTGIKTIDRQQYGIKKLDIKRNKDVNLRTGRKIVPNKVKNIEEKPLTLQQRENNIRNNRPVLDRTKYIIESDKKVSPVKEIDRYITNKNRKQGWNKLNKSTKRNLTKIPKIETKSSLPQKNIDESKILPQKEIKKPIKNTKVIENKSIEKKPIKVNESNIVNNESKVNINNESKVEIKQEPMKVKVKSKKEVTIDQVNEAKKVRLSNYKDKFKMLDNKQLDSELQGLKKMRSEMVKSFVEKELKPGKGNKPTQGGVLRDKHGDVIGRYGRQSNNAEWYQEYFKKTGRTYVTKSDYDEIASKYMSNEFGYKDSKTFNELNKTIKEMESIKQSRRDYDKNINNIEFKRSKFSGTVKNSKNTKKGFSKIISQKEYEVATDKDYIDRASKEINEDFNKVYSDLVNKSSKYEYNADEITKAQLIIRKLQNQGKFTEASHFLDTISDSLTKSGQAIQKASLWNKMTPEGRLNASKKVLQKARGIAFGDKHKILESEIDKIQSTINKLELRKKTLTDFKAIKKVDDDIVLNSRILNQTMKKLPKKYQKMFMTTQEETLLLDRLNGINAMPDRYEKDFALALLNKQVSDKIPSSIGRKINTIQTMSQLLGFKTIFRNIIGNSSMIVAENIKDIFGIPLDMIVSLGTKKRTTFFPNLLEQSKAFISEAKLAAKEVKAGIDVRDIGSQYELSGTTFKKGVMGQLEKVLNYTLKVPDRAFYAAAKSKSLRNLMKEANVNVATPDMHMASHLDGIYATFQDSNAISNALMAIKTGLDKIGIKDFGLSNFLIKYARTPGNLLARTIDYSPIGMVKAITKMAANSYKGNNFNQKELVNGLARGLTGIPLIYAAYHLKQLDIIHGSYLEDSKVTDFRRSSGLNKYGINVSALRRYVLSGFDPDFAKPKKGDIDIDYAWFQPMAGLFNFGSNIKDSVKKGDALSYAGIAVGTLEGSLNTMAENPLMMNISNMMKYGFSEGIKKNITSIPSSFVPQMLNDIRKVTDNSVRLTESDKLYDSMANQVINKIPILSKKLPEYIDTNGKGKKFSQAKGAERILNILFNPANISTYSNNKQSDVLYQIYKNTDEKRQLPREVGKSYTFYNSAGDRVKYVLTPKQRMEMQKYIGKYAYQLIQDNVSDDIDEYEQIKILESFYDSVNLEAKYWFEDKYFKDIDKKGEIIK